MVDCPCYNSAVLFNAGDSVPTWLFRVAGCEPHRVRVFFVLSVVVTHLQSEPEFVVARQNLSDQGTLMLTERLDALAEHTLEPCASIGFTAESFYTIPYIH